MASEIPDPNTADDIEQLSLGFDYLLDAQAAELENVPVEVTGIDATLLEQPPDQEMFVQRTSNLTGGRLIDINPDIDPEAIAAEHARHKRTSDAGLEIARAVRSTWPGLADGPLPSDNNRDDWNKEPPMKYYASVNDMLADKSSPLADADVPDLVEAQAQTTGYSEELDPQDALPVEADPYKGLSEELADAIRSLPGPERAKALAIFSKELEERRKLEEQIAMNHRHALRRKRNAELRARGRIPPLKRFH